MVLLPPYSILLFLLLYFCQIRLERSHDLMPR
jgi:hypothetical protein